MLTLAGNNPYYGATIVEGGTLALANSLAIQNSMLDTSGGGTLSFGTLTSATLGGLTGSGGLNLTSSSSVGLALSVGNNGVNSTFSGVLKGSGSLNKIGSGTLLSSGSSTYTGPTTISQGELLVNGSMVSPLTVQSGGTLGGTGSVAGVTVSAGGHLAPGDAPGQLTLTGDLSLLSGAKMDYELDAPSDSDEVYMPTNLLSLNGQQFSDFNFTSLGGFGPGSYTLIDAGSVSGTLGGNTSGTIDGLPASLAVQGNDLVLTVVPEPGALVLLCGFGTGMACFAWTRRKPAR